MRDSAVPANWSATYPPRGHNFEQFVAQFRCAGRSRSGLRCQLYDGHCVAHAHADAVTRERIRWDTVREWVEERDHTGSHAVRLPWACMYATWC